MAFSPPRPTGPEVRVVPRYVGHLGQPPLGGRSDLITTGLRVSSCSMNPRGAPEPRKKQKMLQVFSEMMSLLYFVVSDKYRYTQLGIECFISRCWSTLHFLCLKFEESPCWSEPCITRRISTLFLKKTQLAEANDFQNPCSSMRTLMLTVLFSTFSRSGTNSWSTLPTTLVGW